MNHKKIKILVVDDEADARDILQKLLMQIGYAVDTAENGAAALALFSENPADVVVTDLRMPEMDGLELLNALRAVDPDVPILMATATGEVSSAVAAIRAGADDYLQKPLDIDELVLCIDRARERRAIRVEADNLRRQLRERDGQGLQGLVGASAVMQKVYRTARQVAGARATVLITGESGTGKGELARAIHALGPRASKPFVSVHCAALPETLLESELFGHEKGAFTGADKRRIGRFEQAEGGTLFLDEIGEVPLSMQIKLLRVLQERQFERVGGNEPLRVDVRIIAATNRDLTVDIRDGRFREDLYYRLAVVAVEMPPLRARGGDILVLANHFLRRFVEENHSRIEGFSEKARAKLIGHAWPGNVRELENAVESAVVMCETATIEAADFPFAGTTAPEGIRIPGSTMAELERYALTKTLESVSGSNAKAAEILDISVRTIQYRLSEYAAAKSRHDD